MVRARIASSLALIGLGIFAAQSATADPRSVIELFTSQGCSSCPAADKLAGELARDPTVLVLSLAIDYWDYLGWKDTLALHGHTERQRAYARARGDREVYTPQAVVNGMVHVLGSDKAAIERALQKSRPTASSLPVTMTVNGDTLTVDVPVGADSAAGEVWLCPLSRSVQVPIGRGENSGRSITYTNVVRGWIKLGDWTGRAESFTVPLSKVRSADVDALAVLVQAGAANAPKAMLGAAQAALK